MWKASRAALRQTMIIWLFSRHVPNGFSAARALLSAADRQRASAELLQPVQVLQTVSPTTEVGLQAKSMSSSHVKGALLLRVNLLLSD